jgi:hypothetical protein
MIQYVSVKSTFENETKKDFFWHTICCCQKGRSFGTGFAVDVIMAGGGRFLPYWQISCHFGGWMSVWQQYAIVAV